MLVFVFPRRAVGLPLCQLCQPLAHLADSTNVPIFPTGVKSCRKFFESTCMVEFQMKRPWSGKERISVDSLQITAFL